MLPRTLAGFQNPLRACDEAVYGLRRSVLRKLHHAMDLQFSQPYCELLSAVSSQGSTEVALLEYASPSAPASSERNAVVAFTQIQAITWKHVSHLKHLGALRSDAINPCKQI